VRGTRRRRGLKGWVGMSMRREESGPESGMWGRRRRRSLVRPSIGSQRSDPIFGLADASQPAQRVHLWLVWVACCGTVDVMELPMLSGTLVPSARMVLRTKEWAQPVSRRVKVWYQL
jgi:hypothetical protein